MNSINYDDCGDDPEFGPDSLECYTCRSPIDHGDSCHYIERGENIHGEYSGRGYGLQILVCQTCLDRVLKWGDVLDSWGSDGRTAGIWTEEDFEEILGGE